MSIDRFPEEITTSEDRLLYIQNLVAENKEQDVCELFSGLTEHELSHILESFPHVQRQGLWFCVPDDMRGEVLAELHEDVRLEILRDIEVEQIAEITKDLDAQDTAEILDSLDEVIEANVMLSMDKSRREEVQNVLDYEPDAVGRYMHTDTISIRENVKLEVVQRFLRMKNVINKSTLELMVVDEHNRLLGSLHVVELILHDPDSLVLEVMEQPDTVLDTMSAIEAGRFIRSKNHHFAPVVNHDNVLMGQLTADDVFELTLEESGQTVMNLAGLDEEEDLFAPIKKV